MKIKYIIPILVSLLILASYFSLQNHESHSEERIEFFMNKPYIAVVKELATKNSLEKMVQENDGFVKSKEWEFFNVEIPQRILRIREYKIDGKLKFVVEKMDADLGKLELPFVQEMHLDNVIFNVNTELEAPQKRVLLCSKKIEMSPLIEDDRMANRTHVVITSKLKVRKTIPFFTKSIMDNKVKQANLKDLDRLKANIMDASGHTIPITISRAIKKA